MSNEDLRKFYERNKKVYETQYDNYQHSGEPRYMYQATRYKDYVEVAERALQAADDHEDAIYMKSMLADAYEKSCRARYNNNLDMYKEALSFLIQFCERDLGFKNRYK